MRLDDDFDKDYDKEYDEYIGNTDSNKSVLGIAIAAFAIAILSVVVIVIYLNPNSRRKHSASADIALANAMQYTEDANKQQNSIDELISGSTLTADDLDFWDDYEKITISESAIPPMEEISANDADMANDNKHTKIVYENGEEEWVQINPYLSLNTYKNSNFVYQKPLLSYYENNKELSFAGVDLSKEDDYVDFVKLKKAGIDFVMLRIGQRGYFTSDITIDEMFEENYDRATKAGLDVGVCFFSHATTKEEAIEEADFVIKTLKGDSISDNNISANGISSNGVSGNKANNDDDNKEDAEKDIVTEKKIQYPIVYYTENVNSKESRTAELNQMQRTNIAIAFMDRVSENGYCPMLYGNKEWLLKKYSIGSLGKYDIWLNQPGDTLDYPYELSMWRYTDNGQISGISGGANIDICFTDYSIK